MRILVLFFCITISGITQGQFKGVAKMLNGVQHKVHHIQSGETIFALSRTYKVTVDKIITSNPKIQDTPLSIGQEVLIPVPKPTTSKTHTVVAGETLFSISKKYNISVEDLMKLNSIEGTELNLGQKLIIQEGEESEGSIPPPDKATSSGTRYTVAKQETNEIKTQRALRKNISSIKIRKHNMPTPNTLRS